MADYTPKWHKELAIFSKIKPLIMLEGNVLDSYQYPQEGSIPKGTILRLTEYLHYFFKDIGYRNIIFFDSLNGFYNNCEAGYLDSFAEIVNAKAENGYVKATFKGNVNSAASMVRTVLTQTQSASVVIMNLASRYIISPDNLDQNEVDSFTRLLQASLDAREAAADKGILKNVLVMIVNKINDIPAWFYLQNPNVKSINITTPTKEEREGLIKDSNFPSFFDKEIYTKEFPFFVTHPDDLDKLQDRFVALTEGFSFTEINGLRKLCKNEHIHIKDMCDVVDIYKYGIKENPWKSLNINDIKTAKDRFEERVKGQDYAITKTLDVVKRAITGMSGLQGSSHSRPKGVLFFAGPTGTGKTETAKALAELLFGDERCCIRFDMSEYGQGHSDQKLLGAPPGYVGYEAGGQLTNAVKRNPFSILLFDEIEKAHPTILDKFLQILEDGRMTDGQGNTVYFSECIIIFTSNLGVYTVNEMGERVANVDMNMSYKEMSDRIRSAIEEHFKLTLGRPELLNRIGENIVIFDYIRADTAKRILSSQVNRIIKNLAVEHNIHIDIADTAYATLEQNALTNLDNGGRGVGNVVENLLINPLSRYLFDYELFGNVCFKITEIDANAMPPLIYGNVVK